MEYSVRPGTISSGRDYEFKLTTLLSLRCLNEDIKEMNLMTNVEGVGHFDDIVLNINRNNGKRTTYLLQIKHRENPKDITSRELLSTKREFNLKKYINSFVERQKYERKSTFLSHLCQNHEELYLVLFTNRGVSKLDCLKHAEENPDLRLINTNNGGDLWTFDFEKLEMPINSVEKKYADKLYLYSNQISLRILDLEIIKIITSVVPIQLPQKTLNSLFKKFTWFISDWSEGRVGGHYALTKTIVIKKLMELLLEPYMVHLKKVETYTSFHRTFWRNLVCKNRVIIIDADDVVDKFLHAYINGEIIERRRAGISHEEYHHSVEYDLLWKRGELPLLVEVHTSDDAQNIIRVLDEFQTFVQVTVIILNKSPNSLADLKGRNLVNTLVDLNGELQEIVLRHTIKLQGKLVRLDKIVTENMFKLLTIKQIIYILLGMFNTGKEAPSLPDFFITIFFTAVLLSAEVLQQIPDEIFVIHCAPQNNFQTFLKENSTVVDYLKVSSFEEFQREANIFCFASTTFLNQWDDLEHIETHIKSQLVHHLYLNNSELEWVRSKGSTKNLRPYRKDKIYSSNINTATELLNRICYEKVSKPVLVIAGPGTGKSTFLNYLARQASNMWTISVQLFENRTYFLSDEFKMALFNPRELLSHFIGKETCKLTKTLFDSHLSLKKVVILLDGFDEIFTDCKEEVTKMIQRLIGLGFAVFVTSRPTAQIYLETAFDTFSYTLAPFSLNHRTKFLTKALSSNTGKGKKTIEVIVEKILSKVDWNPKNILGDGMLLKVLSELNFKDCEEIEDLNLTFLMDNYVQKEFQVIDVSKRDMLYFRALLQVFSKDVLFRSNVYKLMAQYDPIALKLSPFEGERILAEYLSAKWLSQNTENKTLIKDIFNYHYTTTRNFFDQILAMGHLSHSKIINKQADVGLTLTRSNTNTLNDVDKGGRSVLHLAAAWGVHHPVNPSEEQIADLRQSIADEKPTLFKTVHINPINSKDELLNYTPLEYALASGSLNIANVICQKLQYLKCSTEISISNIDTHYVLQYIKIFQYDFLQSVLDKYLNRLELTPDVLHVEIDEKCSDKNFPSLEGDEGYYTMPRGSQALRNQQPLETEDENLLLGAAQKGYTDIIYSLLSKGADLEFPDKSYGKTALILAADRGHTDLVTLLLSKGANLEATDNDWMTPLHWAAYCGHVNVLNLLLARGANVEAKDRDGMTPLHWAVQKMQKETVELLLIKNAMIESKNYGGLNSLDLAKSSGHEKIASILEKKLKSTNF